MANLKTDYKDDILDSTQNLRRKFRMITNDDGTFSFEDVTDYLQYGDSFGALDINAITNAIMNECLKRIDTVDNLESTSTYLPLSANMGRELNENIKIIQITVSANIAANTVYDHAITITDEQKTYGNFIIAIPYGTSTGSGQAIPVQCYKSSENTIMLKLYNPSATAIASTVRQYYFLYFFKNATRH